MERGERFADTGGWGFEAFDAAGKKHLTQGASVECYACHTQVEGPHFVFSTFVE